MAITANQLVQEADIVDLFKTNVYNIVISSDLYHSGKRPSLSGTAGTFVIPAADMDPLSAVNGYNPNLGNKDEIISAGTIYNVLLDILRNYSRIRNFRFELFWNDALEKSVSGKGVFKENLSSIASPWQRNLNDLAAEPKVSNTIANTTPDAGDMTQLFTNMLNAWKSIANTTLVYKYMSCHSSCHSSHSDRGRR